MLLEATHCLVYDGLSLPEDSKFGGLIHFFLYDSIKIFGLLTIMMLAISLMRTWLPEQRLRQWMSRGGVSGNFLAAAFGAITPFCSCSSIPIFISLLKAGVPLGIAFSFLITSPIINEYLVILMIGEFGLAVSLAYVCSGLLIGTLAGALLGRLKLEALLEPDMVDTSAASSQTVYSHFSQRVRYAVVETWTMIRQIWLWILVGVGIGAFIYNYIPEESLHSLMQATGIFSVPLATLLGIPMYGSCAAIVPVAVVLFQKGIPLGTALAFMMAMAALSLPEAIMLRRIMRLKLIAIYFGLTALAIIFTGYLLNLLAQWL